MNTPIAFKINESSETMYYNSKELFEYNPEFYYGCKSKPRTIIQKKNIPESEYIYANLKLKEWNTSSADCKKAQLLISKSWIDKHYFKLNPTMTELNVTASVPITIEETTSIENAPPILHLTDAEKFTDCDGNIIEIETRGEKDRNKIFFNVKDVMTGFNMPNLDCTLRNNHATYINNIHYKHFFNRGKQYQVLSDTIKKCLYLTYKGLLRVLYASNTKDCERFQDWANDKLFTIQMGSKEEKIKLGTDILNISTKTYKAVFETYASKFPCIYLLSLGKVGLLRDTFGIDSSVSDDSTVYKYGFTDDLTRRIGEHEAKYGKLQNVNIKLSTFHIIDVKYTSEAEKEIREVCTAFEKKLNVEGYKELIVLNEKEHIQIKKYYKHIGIECAGATAELQSQIIELKEKIKDFENEIINIKVHHKNELLEKDMIIHREINEKHILQIQLDHTQAITNLEKQNYTLQIQLLTKK